MFCIWRLDFLIKFIFVIAVRIIFIWFCMETLIMQWILCVAGRGKILFQCSFSISSWRFIVSSVININLMEGVAAQCKNDSAFWTVYFFVLVRVQTSHLVVSPTPSTASLLLFVQKKCQESIFHKNLLQKMYWWN